MPTAKLGQIASNDINDLSQKHFDVDMKIRDILSAQSLDVKRMLCDRLQGVCDQIKTEMDSRDKGMM
jgi:hypothetical protein